MRLRPGLAWALLAGAAAVGVCAAAAAAAPPLGDWCACASAAWCDRAAAIPAGAVELSSPYLRKRGARRARRGLGVPARFLVAMMGPRVRRSVRRRARVRRDRARPSS